MSFLLRSSYWNDSLSRFEPWIEPSTLVVTSSMKEKCVSCVAFTVDNP